MTNEDRSSSAATRGGGVPRGSSSLQLPNPPTPLSDLICTRIMILIAPACPPPCPCPQRVRSRGSAKFFGRKSCEFLPRSVFNGAEKGETIWQRRRFRGESG